MLLLVVLLLVCDSEPLLEVEGVVLAELAVVSAEVLGLVVVEEPTWAVPYVVSVAGLDVVVLVVADTPVVSVEEDLVVWLQPLRTKPRSAAIKIVFFIGD